MTPIAALICYCHMLFTESYHKSLNSTYSLARNSFHIQMEIFLSPPISKRPKFNRHDLLSLRTSQS